VSIYDEIKAERQRQIEKWGEQNHPILAIDEFGLDEREDPDCFGEDLCNYYEIPMENTARYLCEIRTKQGRVTYMDILIEELSEAVAAGENTKALRTELVQCGAVVVAMLEALDRNGR
jgi:hypothetical protein